MVRGGGLRGCLGGFEVEWASERAGDEERFHVDTLEGVRARNHRTPLQLQMRPGRCCPAGRLSMSVRLVLLGIVASICVKRWLQRFFYLRRRVSRPWEPNSTKICGPARPSIDQRPNAPWL